MKKAILTALAAVAVLAPMVQGTAQAEVRSFPVTTTLDGRTVKDPDVPVGKQRVADMYAKGTKVKIVCQDKGPEYGGKGIWDLTVEGLWIPDGYVETGSDGMVMAKCAIPKSYPAKTDLNGRKNKGDAATAPGSVVDKYEEGQQVPVKCQAQADGGTIWDFTTDNLWVPDTYVKTGVDGFVQGLPRCDTDGIDGGEEPPGNVVHGRSNGPAGPATGTNAEKVKRVIDTAKSQMGKGFNYSWGAGGKGGASYGIHHYPDGDPSQGDDYNRLGYDCSGLTLYAFWKGAGIDIGSWTGPQNTKGRAVALSARQPGDLVFWGRSDNDSDATTHVAIYLGDNKILEAAPPRDGKSVRISDLYRHGNPYTKVRRIIG
ncbi:NlpC/P60 family protein [Lentzea tibetensis]|uniref:NlpC/P60 family protein n=1 Tax=Lentzea tibetensis TaxID=2591470 RepID=A0A563F051_9PSEU|nr:NlpC/P60 family protein [Lentzea tibetensis]TWP53355.1 NlpC/P60 family protein [Lentzea tibetensis]